MRRHPANVVDLAPSFAVRIRAILLTLAAFVSGGCQPFAPGNTMGLTSSRQEKKILKQAEVDPFPSPADVGLAEPEAKP